jgi:hypothetical protein
MFHQRSERALRRLVDELAALPPADAAAILGELSDQQREAVEALLREHANFVVSDDVPEESDGLGELALSSWLVDRISGAGTERYAITSASRAALRECAVQILPLGAAALPAVIPLRRSLASKIGGRLRRGRDL